MKTIKIEKEVTKEDVFVCVANTSEYDEVYRIITAGGEQILKRPFERLITYSPLEGYWVAVGSVGDKYQISIPQLAELLGVEYPLKPKFEVGKWYIAERGTKIFCHNGKFDEDGDPCGYGVVCSIIWADATGIGWGGDYREATPEEVEGALIAEAKRRYEVGDRVSQVNCYNKGSMYGEEPWAYKGVDEWLVQDNNLFNENLCLMLNGKWAEVIEQKQLPTLEELIAEAKSKITEKTTVYPDWVDGTKEVTSYIVAGTEYMSEKLAIIGYISKRLREEYL